MEDSNFPSCICKIMINIRPNTSDSGATDPHVVPLDVRCSRHVPLGAARTDAAVDPREEQYDGFRASVEDQNRRPFGPPSRDVATRDTGAKLGRHRCGRKEAATGGGKAGFAA